MTPEDYNRLARETKQQNKPKQQANTSSRNGSSKDRERAVPRSQNPPIPVVIISTLQSKGLVLDNLQKVLLKSRDITGLIPEQDVVALRPNKIAESRKGKTGNEMVQLMAPEMVNGPLQVFQPRPISPREVAFGSPKTSQGSRKITPKKEVVNGVRATATKGTSTFSDSMIIQ